MKRTLQRFLNHKNGFCTAMFFCFMLVQFIVLRLGNQAGQGYLEVEQQEFVYFFLQCTVIVGWLLYVLIGVRIRNKKVYTALLATVTGLFALCAQMMLYAPANTPFYLALTGVTVLCLGVMLGTVYERLAAYIHTGAKAGYCCCFTTVCFATVFGFQTGSVAFVIDFMRCVAARLYCRPCEGTKCA